MAIPALAGLLVLLLLLFNFVMHCIISTVVVAFEINYLISYLILSYLDSKGHFAPGREWQGGDGRTGKGIEKK